MFVIVAVFVFGLSIFFKVRTVEVVGNSLYSADEIAAASGIELGDNLVTMSEGAAAGKIMAVLPYVENVRIGKSLPDTVVITVTESDASYAVSDAAGGQWLINSSCKVLAQAVASAADYPKITGVTAVDPVVGSPLQCEQAENLEAIKLVLAELESTDYISKIVEINAEKVYDIILLYADKYEIRLGGSDEMPYKIKYLTAALEQLEDYQTGVIDLTFEEDKVAHFRPW